MAGNRRMRSVPAPTTPSAPEMRRTAQLWERFVTGQPELSLDELPPIIQAAWQRSKQAGVDPTLPHAPSEESLPFAELRRVVSWLSCAEPTLSFLQSVLSEPHQLILLGDHHGRVLFADGGHKALSRAEELRGIPGGNWSEQRVGCSILGTSLCTGTPVQVRWQENYCATWQDWVSQSAPIYDPTTHEIVGVLGIAGYRELTHPRALELVIQAATLIEAAIGAQETHARLSLLERFTQLGARYPSESLVATDKHGKILAASSSVEQMSDIPAPHLIGRRIHEIPVLREYFPHFTAPIPSNSSREHTLPANCMSFPVSGHGTVMMLPKLPRLSSLRRHIDQAWTTAYTFADLVGQSTVLRGCIELAHCASQHDWPVLVLGESGTGKELLAQAIHNASPRRDSPFIALNCASVSEELIGTELFGYTDGTFTGALKGGKIGKIQLAHTGTLFLDDVDGMPLKMQASLLRVLEEGRVVPLGAREPRRVDVRVIAASNADLEQAVQEKRFRHDLFYRLNVFPIALPPLRERTADIPVLVQYFLARHAPEKELSKEVLHILCRYSWPGNVRELRNVLIAATARARGKVITPSDLPPSVISHPLSHIEVSSAHPHTLQETESEIILRTVQRTGSIPQAASQLGIHYSTLYRKLKKLQLHLPLRLQKDQD